MTMEFWQGESCEYCNGPSVEKKIDLLRRVKRKYVLVKNVSAGVCLECGARYDAANVLKTIDARVCGRGKADRKILMPVYSL
jgi:YgiT-type zinc finger domain-containing protein